MRCPFCGGLDDRVIDSRLSQGGEAIRRRRVCDGCGRRFTTYERLELSLPVVVKRDRRREPFQRDKVLAGLRRACVKRAVPSEALEQLVGRLERSLAESGESEVSSREIGERVLQALRGIDLVAYVRFASVYREYRDLQQFVDELDGLLGERESKGPR